MARAGKRSGGGRGSHGAVNAAQSWSERRVVTRQAPPIWAQVAELLMRDIAAGRLAEGDRLPPERVMAAELGIAVGTLRKGLDHLAGQGMMERVQGSGNYIRTGNLRNAFYPMFRIELRAGGGLPTARVLDLAVMDKPEDLPGFGTSARASRIRRLRFLDDQPVAAEEIWLDASVGEIRADGLEMSLYDYYRTRLGFWITAAEDRVTLGPMPDWAPGALACRPDETAGHVERFSWADGPVPVEFSRTWFDTGRAVYVQRMT